MTKKTRRKFTTQQRAEILRRHLKNKDSVADLCEEYKIQPSVFYRWQAEALENLESALSDGRRNRADYVEAKIKGLEKELVSKGAELVRKDAIIAEVAEAFVSLKKQSGPST